MRQEQKPDSISESAWHTRHQLHEDFASREPLAGFVVIPNFLTDELFREVQEFARNVSMRRYCVYSRTGSVTDLEKGFCEPHPDFYYLTTHSRMFEWHGLPSHIERLVSSPDMIEYLSNLSGISLTGHQIPGTLTGWNAGDFLGEHCDEGDSNRPNKLVISLSLTSDWNSEYGGTTHYKWTGGKQEVVIMPTGNVATVFAPGEHSVHWVSPIAANAPTGRRYTWTLDYF